VSTERKRKAGSGELDRLKQQVNVHQQQQAASAMYVGNIQAQLTCAVYQVQSFQHTMGQHERQLEQQIVVAHVKDIEVKKKEADMEQIKLCHAKDIKELTQCKYDAEVVHTNAIAQAGVTHHIKQKNLCKPT
jgi:hypothetical protein